MTILLGDFKVKVGREDIFKLIIGNESLHEVSNDNLQNLRHKNSRIFRNKKREYLKDRINELETKNKIKILEICAKA
jgi:hypothetical protein